MVTIGSVLSPFAASEEVAEKHISFTTGANLGFYGFSNQSYRWWETFDGQEVRRPREKGFRHADKDRRDCERIVIEKVFVKLLINNPDGQRAKLSTRRKSADC